LDIRFGEIEWLVGETGCGKSMTAFAVGLLRKMAKMASASVSAIELAGFSSLRFRTSLTQNTSERIAL
jgi:ABC-type dipeptide/oligopeptide/nickel transport system ATPase component